MFCIFTQKQVSHIINFSNFNKIHKNGFNMRELTSLSYLTLRFCHEKRVAASRHIEHHCNEIILHEGDNQTDYPPLRPHGKPHQEPSLCRLRMESAAWTLGGCCTLVSAIIELPLACLACAFAGILHLCAKLLGERMQDQSDTVLSNSASWCSSTAMTLVFVFMAPFTDSTLR